MRLWTSIYAIKEIIPPSDVFEQDTKLNPTELYEISGSYHKPMLSLAFLLVHRGLCFEPFLGGPCIFRASCKLSTTMTISF